MRAEAQELAESVAARVDAIYLKHHKRVYAIALNYGGGSHAWAEDVTQDVFFTLLEKIKTLPDRGDPGPWLRRVAINRCISLQRRRAVRQSPIVRWMLSDAPAPVEPEAQLEVSDELRRVWRALEKLPAKQRGVFCLRHLDGESQVEIASVLGLSEGYVSKLLRRAETTVRAEIRREEDDA
ncbi:MAG: RNA polymerase sigma factor [Myxococcota bacterium]